MVPETISERISDLRRLERRLRLVWGGASFFALAAVVMLLACLVDWRTDLADDTPMAVRWVMLLGQLVLWAVAGFFLLLRPAFQRLPDDDLALWVERKLPVFEQRLISAVQLNRPGADTRGMSGELIGAVTREAEKFVLASQLLDLPDRRRLRWGLIACASTLVLVAASWLFFGQAFPVLVARQFLAERAIPRSVSFKPDYNSHIWPAGEPGRLLLLVTSKRRLEAQEALLHLRAEGRAAETYPLTLQTDLPVGSTFRADGTVSLYAGRFQVEIPPGSTPFQYQARIGDGRTAWRKVSYVPRPAVTKQEAWLLLPDYVGRRPDGQPYVQPQPRGDLVAVSGSKAVVRFELNKPNVEVGVRTYSRPMPQMLAYLQWSVLDLPTSPLASQCSLLASAFTGRALQQLEADEAAPRRDFGPEFPSRYHAPARGGPRDLIEFELLPEETAYRILTYDEFYFQNLRPPRRSITVIPDEPPSVALLPERFSPAGIEGLAEDVEVTNMPLLLGEAVQVGYYCRDPLGLDRAEFRYRINDGSWRRMPLRETPADDAKGPFDPRRGLFRGSPERAQVHFHAVPSPDLNLVPGRLEGGGRFDFQTRGIPGLKLGDTLEFCVEVYDRNPEPDRPPGRSEIRQKKLVTEQQFKDWVWQTLQHEKRLRALEKEQRGVFEKKEPGR